MDKVEQVLVNRSQMATILGCSRPKTYHLERRGKGFPKPVRDTLGTQMWIMDEIMAYIEQLKAERDSESA